MTNDFRLSGSFSTFRELFDFRLSNDYRLSTIPPFRPALSGCWGGIFVQIFTENQQKKPPVFRFGVPGGVGGAGAALVVFLPII